MLALILDIVAGHFLAKLIRNTWAQVGIAVLAGLLNSVVANLLIHLFFPEMRPGEVVLRIVAGFAWHPLITLIALWYFRRKYRSGPQQQDFDRD